MSTTKPEALRLAEGLESIFISEEIHATKAQKIAAELRRLHARIADLESQLVKEAARSADEKRRADQMTEQHRMQAAMNAEARAKLASIGAGYTAADMATAAAQGFRDGAASVAASAGSEPVAWLVCTEEGDPDMVFLSQHEAQQYLEDDERPTPLYTHPSPPEGMLGGWQDIATAPVAGLILLVVEDSAGERRVFPAEASHENGVWVWQVTLGWLGWTRLHSGWTPILWRRIPTLPTTSAGSGKGE